MRITLSLGSPITVIELYILSNNDLNGTYILIKYY